MTEPKSLIEDFNNKLDQAEEGVSKSEDISFEIIQSKKQKENIKKNEESLQDLWDTKRNNICIMGLSEVAEKEKWSENIFKEIMAENVTNLGREMDIQIHEVQKIPNRLNLKISTQRHIIIKLSKVKDKEKTLKAEGEKQLIT